MNTNPAPAIRIDRDAAAREKNSANNLESNDRGNQVQEPIPPARFDKESQETQKAPENQGLLPIVASPCDTLKKYKIPPRGVEPLFSD